MKGFTLSEQNIHKCITTQRVPNIVGILGKQVMCAISREGGMQYDD